MVYNKINILLCAYAPMLKGIVECTTALIWPYDGTVWLCSGDVGLSVMSLLVPSFIMGY